MILLDTLRLGSDSSDIEGKSTSHIWIHPEGGIYVRYSYRYAIPGWKLSGKRITDYWGVVWHEVIPANTIPIEEIIFS